MYCLTKKIYIYEQCMLWRTVSSSFPVNDNEVLSAGSVIQGQEPEEWSSSDEGR